MAEPHIRHAREPGTWCRCPEGWPKLVGASIDGELTRLSRHHPMDCGLPEDMEATTGEESTDA